MSKFENVSVSAAGNVYFEGKVTSRTLEFADGTKKTLGFMLPGEYEFATAAKELMEVTAGEMDILLAGTTEWQTYSAGSSFYVPANSKFSVKVKEVTDYCCSYLD